MTYVVLGRAPPRLRTGASGCSSRHADSVITGERVITGEDCTYALAFFVEVLEAFVVTTPGDDPHSSLSDGLAALFGSLGTATPIRIVGCLIDGADRSVAQLSASLDADAHAVHAHVGALQRHGVLVSGDDGATAQYGVKDIRIFELLELAAEIAAARPAGGGPGLLFGAEWRRRESNPRPRSRDGDVYERIRRSVLALRSPRRRGS